MPRQNILLVVFDQFRADLLFGGLSAHAHTPHLDAFAAEATSFRRHFSVASPCGPSRASLFTGQYAMNHRSVRNGTPLRHGTPNLAQALRALDYDPWLFGYTDTTHDPTTLSADDPVLKTYEELLPGFTEVTRLRLETDVTSWMAHLAGQGYPPVTDETLYVPVDGKLNGPALYRAEDSDTAFLTDQAIQALAAAEPGWCATLCYIRPHPPFVAPAPYNTMFDPAEMPAPAETFSPEGDRDWHPFLAPAQDGLPIAGMVQGFPQLPPTPENIAQLRATYLGLVAEVDHHFGRLITRLKDNGQYEDTVIAVTADHGEMLGDYGLWGKGSFHDASFHVPLIIRDATRPNSHGTAVDAMTESIDVAATLLDLAGGEAPDSMDGQSVVALLDDPEAPWKRVTMSELDFGNPILPTPHQTALGLSVTETSLAVLRTQTHNIVQFASDLAPILFDRAGDGERRDISQTSEGHAVRHAMTEALLRHRMQHADRTFSRTLVFGGGVRRL